MNSALQQVNYIEKYDKKATDKSMREKKAKGVVIMLVW